MVEVALVAFAAPWGWGCSLALTDPTMGTITDTDPLEGAAQGCSYLPNPGSHFEDFTWMECKNSGLRWATAVVILMLPFCRRQLEWDCEPGVEKGALAPSALPAVTLPVSPSCQFSVCAGYSRESLAVRALPSLLSALIFSPLRGPQGAAAAVEMPAAMPLLPGGSVSQQ